MILASYSIVFQHEKKGIEPAGRSENEHAGKKLIPISSSTNRYAARTSGVHSRHSFFVRFCGSSPQLHSYYSRILKKCQGDSKFLRVTEYPEDQIGPQPDKFCEKWLRFRIPRNFPGYSEKIMPLGIWRALRQGSSSALP